MEYVVRQFGVNKQRHSVLKGGRYRFGDPNPHQPTYGRKYNQSSLLFTIDDAAKDFQPFNYCNSIQMLIKRLKQMILSVSRRTDIPAFYSDWFSIG